MDTRGTISTTSIYKRNIPFKTSLKIESEVFSCIIMDFLILMLQSLRLARISFLQVTAFNLRDGSKLPADMGVIGIRAHARR